MQLPLDVIAPMAALAGILASPLPARRAACITPATWLSAN